MGEWSFQPSVVFGSALLAAGYLYAVGPGRWRFRGAAPVPPARIAAFLAGVAVLFLALASPLDELGDRYLLTAHMIQHMLLTMVMPPLLLLGTPGWLLRPLLKSWLVTDLGRVVTRAVPAYVLFNVVFGVSHFPVIYEAALENERLHILEHLAYMVTATIMWWPLLSPLPELPRLPYPLQLLYVFLQTLPTVMVGAVITLADGVLYHTYASAPRIIGFSALEDQQLAGLIMWVGGAMYLFVVLSIVFFAWAHREEVQTLRPA